MATDPQPDTLPSDGRTEYVVRVAKRDLTYRLVGTSVLSLPGLVRVELLTHDEADLIFATATGCSPAGAQHIFNEVDRMGARPMAITERRVG